MMNIALFILLILISSDNFLDLTSAVSSGTPAKNDKYSKKNHRESQHAFTGKVRRRIPWTPTLRSELVQIWQTTFPRSEGHASRIYQRWCELHPKYCNITPIYLKKYAEEIRQDKGKIVEPDRFGWNDELNAELMKLWDKTYSPRPKSGHTKDLYNEWIQRHPNFASRFSSRYLKSHATSLIREDTKRQLARGEASELVRSRLEYFERIDHRVNWTPDLMSDLLKFWYGNKEECKRKRFAEWKQLHPEFVKMSLTSLERQARKSRKLIEAGKRPEEAGTAMHSSGNYQQSPKASIEGNDSVIGRQPSASRSYHENSHQEHYANPREPTNLNQSMMSFPTENQAQEQDEIHKVSFSHDLSLQKQPVWAHYKDNAQTSSNWKFQRYDPQRANDGDVDLDLHLK